MPNKDGTGPMGQGAMTGRGNGYCVVPLNRENGRIFDGGGFYGRGGGRGRRNCFYATNLPGWMRGQGGGQAFGGFGRVMSKEDELAALKNKVVYLKEELEAVQGRVQVLESK